MQKIRDAIILMVLFLVLATFRIAPLPDVDLQLMPAQAGVTQAEDSPDAVEPLTQPELASIAPGQFDWQSADCSRRELTDSRPTLVPVDVNLQRLALPHITTQALRPVLQKLTDLDVRCSSSEPGNCVVIVHTNTKT